MNTYFLNNPLFGYALFISSFLLILLPKDVGDDPIGELLPAFSIPNSISFSTAIISFLLTNYIYKFIIYNYIIYSVFCKCSTTFTKSIKAFSNESFHLLYLLDDSFCFVTVSNILLHFANNDL